MLIKGANYLEQLAKTDIAVFDKTGTLTRGTFEVTAIHPNQIRRKSCWSWPLWQKANSDHPISASLRAAWNRALDKNRVTDVQEIAGRGIHALVDGRVGICGEMSA